MWVFTWLEWIKAKQYHKNHNFVAGKFIWWITYPFPIAFSLKHIQNIKENYFKASFENIPNVKTFLEKFFASLEWLVKYHILNGTIFSNKNKGENQNSLETSLEIKIDKVSTKYYSSRLSTVKVLKCHLTLIDQCLNDWSSTIQSQEAVIQFLLTNGWNLVWVRLDFDFPLYDIQNRYDNKNDAYSLTSSFVKSDFDFFRYWESNYFISYSDKDQISFFELPTNKNTTLKRNFKTHSLKTNYTLKNISPLNISAKRNQLILFLQKEKRTYLVFIGNKNLPLKSINKKNISSYLIDSPYVIQCSSDIKLCFLNVSISYKEENEKKNHLNILKNKLNIPTLFPIINHSYSLLDIHNKATLVYWKLNKMLSIDEWVEKLKSFMDNYNLSKSIINIYQQYYPEQVSHTLWQKYIDEQNLLNEITYFQIVSSDVYHFLTFHFTTKADELIFWKNNHYFKHVAVYHIPSNTWFYSKPIIRDWYDTVFFSKILNDFKDNSYDDTKQLINEQLLKDVKKVKDVYLMKTGRAEAKGFEKRQQIKQEIDKNNWTLKQDIIINDIDNIEHNSKKDEKDIVTVNWNQLYYDDKILPNTFKPWLKIEPDYIYKDNYIIQNTSLITSHKSDLSYLWNALVVYFFDLFEVDKKSSNLDFTIYGNIQTTSWVWKLFIALKWSKKILSFKCEKIFSDKINKNTNDNESFSQIKATLKAIIDLPNDYQVSDINELCKIWLPNDMKEILKQSNNRYWEIEKLEEEYFASIKKTYLIKDLFNDIIKEQQKRKDCCLSVEKQLNYDKGVLSNYNENTFITLNDYTTLYTKSIPLYNKEKNSYKLFSYNKTFNFYITEKYEFSTPPQLAWLSLYFTFVWVKTIDIAKQNLLLSLTLYHLYYPWRVPSSLNLFYNLCLKQKAYFLIVECDLNAINDTKDIYLLALDWTKYEISEDIKTILKELYLKLFNIQIPIEWNRADNSLSINQQIQVFLESIRLRFSFSNIFEYISINCNLINEDIFIWNQQWAKIVYSKPSYHQKLDIKINSLYYKKQQDWKYKEYPLYSFSEIHKLWYFKHNWHNQIRNINSFDESRSEKSISELSLLNKLWFHFYCKEDWNNKIEEVWYLWKKIAICDYDEWNLTTPNASLINHSLYSWARHFQKVVNIPLKWKDLETLTKKDKKDYKEIIVNDVCNLKYKTMI